MSENQTSIYADVAEPMEKKLTPIPRTCSTSRSLPSTSLPLTTAMTSTVSIPSACNSTPPQLTKTLWQSFVKGSTTDIWKILPDSLTDARGKSGQHLERLRPVLDSLLASWQKINAVITFLVPGEVGGAGILRLSGMRNVCANGYRLLTCPNDEVRETTWDSLKTAVNLQTRLVPDMDDVPDYLYGSTDGKWAKPIAMSPNYAPAFQSAPVHFVIPLLLSFGGAQPLVRC